MNVPQWLAGTHAQMHTLSIPILGKKFVKQKKDENLSEHKFYKDRENYRSVI